MKHLSARGSTQGLLNLLITSLILSMVITARDITNYDISNIASHIFFSFRNFSPQAKVKLKMTMKIHESFFYWNNIEA